MVAVVVSRSQRVHYSGKNSATFSIHRHQKVGTPTSSFDWLEAEPPPSPQLLEGVHVLYYILVRGDCAHHANDRCGMDRNAIKGSLELQGQKGSFPYVLWEV